MFAAALTALELSRSVEVEEFCYVALLISAV